MPSSSCPRWVTGHSNYHRVGERDQVPPPDCRYPPLKRIADERPQVSRIVPIIEATSETGRVPIVDSVASNRSMVSTIPSHPKSCALAVESK